MVLDMPPISNDGYSPRGSVIFVCFIYEFLMFAYPRLSSRSLGTDYSPVPFLFGVISNITIIFRHVMLPKELVKLVPKTHLMTEAEWRSIGVQQSQGWVHYMLHTPGNSTFNVLIDHNIL